MNTTSQCCDPRVAAVAVARWCLGVILLFYGIGKFPDVRGFAEGYILPTFAETWLPKWLLTPFAFSMPLVEVALGALLVLGVYRNVVLFLAALFFIALTFGQILLQQPPVVFYNMVYTLTAAALLFLSAHDRWVLFPRPKGTGMMDDGLLD